MNEPSRKRTAPDERLRGRDTIHRLFETGFSARRGRVVARFVFSDARPTPLRCGVATSRRIPNAVVRNRCKRWLREAVREHKGESIQRLHDLNRSVDVMFIWMDPRVNAGMKLLPEISRSVHELFDTISAAALPGHDSPLDRAH